MKQTRGRRWLLCALAFFIGLCLIAGTAVMNRASAEEENYDWTTLSGGMSAASSDDGFARFSGIDSETLFQSRIAYSYKVHLDGATFYLRDRNTLAKGDYFGLYLANDPGDPVPTSSGGFVMNYRKGFNGGGINTSQTRFGIQSGYEINAGDTPLVYADEEEFLKSVRGESGLSGFGGTKSLVTSDAENYGLSIKFTLIDASSDSHDETVADYWKIEVRPLLDTNIWTRNAQGSGCNYGYDTANKVCTVYMYDSAVRPNLDENGNTGIVLFATNTASTSHTPAPECKIEDENQTKWESEKDQLISAANEALDAYDAGVDGIKDYLDYMNCKELKTAAENAVSVLREKDHADAAKRLSSITEKLDGKDIPVLEDKEWIDVGSSTTGGQLTEDDKTFGVYDPETRWTSIGGLVQWGRRAYYSSKVHLDGATIYLRDEGTTENDDYWGFVLSRSTEGYFQSADSRFAGVFRKGLYSNGTQTRFQIGPDHDFSNECYAWPMDDFTLGSYGYNFGPATSMVMTNADNYGLSIHFEKHTEAGHEEGGYWKVTIASLYAGAIWTSSPNYDAAKMSTTVYVRPSKIENLLDGNGDVYVIACGDIATKGVLQFKVEDSNYTSYVNGALKTQTEAVEAYGAKAATVDAEQFSGFLGERDRLLRSVNSLRGNDATMLSMRVRKYDETLAENAGVQTHLESLLTAGYAAAEAAKNSFETESKISESAISSARTALENGRGIYATYETMLSKANERKFLALDEAIEYSIDKAEALLWLVGYEGEMKQLESLTGDALIRKIASVQLLRSGYEETKAHEIVETKLTSEDKNSYGSRVDTADGKLEALLTQHDAEVKTYYLSELENSLKDVSTKVKLDAAYERKLQLEEFAPIAEKDGALNTRYQTACADFAKGCESYIGNQVNAINNALDSTTFTKLNDFALVKSIYERTDTRYLAFCSREVNESFEKAQKRMLDHNLYWFSVTAADSGLEFLNTEWGMYFEFLPDLANRLNYNKQLDMKEGITLEMTFDEYATLATAHSNNIFLNFVGEPDSFKGMSDGLTCILWMSDDSSHSYLRVYNYTDSEVAYVAFHTPVEGGSLKISVKYEEEYEDYDGDRFAAVVIVINDGEATLVVSEETLTANGHSLPTDVYFSLGAACNIRTYRDAITINRIGCGDDVKDFALEQLPGDVTEPEPGEDEPGKDEPGEDKPGEDKPGEDKPGEEPGEEPGEDKPGEDKKKGCGSMISAGAGILLLVILLGAALLLVRSPGKKKGGK